MNPTDFKYELFFELSPDLLCIAGYDGYFKKINPAVAKTLGYTMEELYSRPVNDFVHPDDQELTAKVRNELTRLKPLFHFENRYLTKSGETIWLSWTSLPVDSDKLIFAVAKNVTHKKRLEAERNDLLAKLSKSNSELIELNQTTSYDLRSPVNNLLALFDLMDLSKIGDEETVQLIEILKYAGEKIKNTLNNCIAQSTESHRTSVNGEETSFQESLDEVLESMSTLMQTSEAGVQADFSEAETIHFNKGYLKSIFLNLVTNAIKFASPERRPVIIIRSVSEKGWVHLIVKDNGAGLDAEKVDYFNTHPMLRPNESKGIGLYLVHTHVLAFGGKIKVESKINEGTTFRISFKSK